MDGRRAEVTITHSGCRLKPLDRGLSMTLLSMREVYRGNLDSVFHGVPVKAMLARHRELVALLRKLKDEQDNS